MQLNTIQHISVQPLSSSFRVNQINMIQYIHVCPSSDKIVWKNSNSNSLNKKILRVQVVLLLPLLSVVFLLFIVIPSQQNRIIATHTHTHTHVSSQFVILFTQFTRAQRIIYIISYSFNYSFFLGSTLLHVHIFIFIFTVLFWRVVLLNVPVDKSGHP
mmetsp:Transcript_13282/g.19108  ORF Transcript_13282/g.19108 Transcript_13282/m.19108 type:complete len:158 (+) Transcript_13282:190-663(+)